MKKFTLPTFIILLIITLSGFFWWTNGTAAVDTKDKTQKQFIITKGEGLRQIANELKSQGLIKDSLVFYFLVKAGGLDGALQAGDFQLSPSQKPSEIVMALTKGPLDIWVTIPEGKRATEIADILQSKIPSFNISWTQQLQAKEGYLFPDTYLIPRDATIERIIDIMTKNFDEKYVTASQGATVSYSQNQAVILASLVEREGNNDNDMKYIASVLENRLQIGMALQVDSTVQYVIGNSFKWWPTPTAADLKINSPYNTYKNPGLPPTPIANPGLVALTAVLHPAKTSYLYYFTDGKGITHFAKTLDEQNANIAKFGL